MSSRDYLSPINQRSPPRAPSLGAVPKDATAICTFLARLLDSNSFGTLRSAESRHTARWHYSHLITSCTFRAWICFVIILLVVIVIHLSSIRRYESNRLSRSVGWYIIIFIHRLIQVCNSISVRVDIDSAWPAVVVVRGGGATRVREQGRRCLQTSVTTHEHLSLGRLYTRGYANNSEPSQMTLSQFASAAARRPHSWDAIPTDTLLTFAFVTVSYRS